MKNTEDTVKDFFKENRNPTDDQIHEFADKMKMNPHKFEEIIYKILSDELHRGD